MTSRIPKPGEPIAGPGGLVTRAWRDYLAQLGGASSLEDIWTAVREIRQQLAQAGAGSFLSGDTTLLGVNSVQTLGQLSDGMVRIQLRGDTPAPAARTFYGANADGVLGYWSNTEGIDVGLGLGKSLDYGPYDFKGELDSEGDLPATVVVGDAYLIGEYLWAGIDEGRPGDPVWDNMGFANPASVLSLDASLNQLNDVDAPTPGDGQALAWSAADSAWKPRTVRTDRNVDGGHPGSIYLPTQRIDGGGP